jgi:hypothetical protein
MEEKDEYSGTKPLLNIKRNRTQDDNENINKKKKKRKNRKKLLKNKLEFFLSDINLYHDSYLKNIYQSNNSSISPEIFLTFNSIKNLLKDIKNDSDRKNVIIKAIEISHKLIYDKTTNQIRRNHPYQENLINPELYDKCTVFIQNFPPIIINHDIIYELFKDYKILYIQLIKGKNHLYTGEAFVTFKNIEDVENIINRFNNSIPKLISELNPKVLKPLKIMTKEDYEKNKINDISNINQAQNENKIVENKNNDNIDEHFLIKINHIKDNLTLNNIKKCLEKIANPQYIDINKNEKSLILRFDSKKTSDFFVSKLKEKNYENIKDILESPIKNNEIFNNIVYELNEKERKDYLNLVKKKIENFKEKKENSKNIKENHKKE